MNRALTALIALSVSLPVAAADFDALKSKAETVDSLASFLDGYVGECKGTEGRGACLAAAKKHRQSLAGKLHWARLLDRHGRLIRVDREAGGGKVRLVITPFFDAGGYGLTDRKPLGFSKGAPRVRLLPVTVQLTEGTALRSFDLALRTGNARLELLFVPQGVWAVGPKAEKARGVRAAFKGLRIIEARTGKVMAEHTF